MHLPWLAAVCTCFIQLVYCAALLLVSDDMLCFCCTLMACHAVQVDREAALLTLQCYPWLLLLR